MDDNISIKSTPQRFSYNINTNYFLSIAMTNLTQSSLKLMSAYYQNIQQGCCNTRLRTHKKICVFI